MKVYIELTKSHPFYKRISRFFSDKKGWKIVQEGFGADYVVTIASVFPGKGYVSKNRVFIATDHVAKTYEMINETKLKCFAIIDLNEELTYLPNGQIIKWKHLVVEHSVPLDAVL